MCSSSAQGSDNSFVFLNHGSCLLRDLQGIGENSLNGQVSLRVLKDTSASLVPAGTLVRAGLPVVAESLFNRRDRACHPATEAPF